MNGRIAEARPYLRGHSVATPGISHQCERRAALRDTKAPAYEMSSSVDIPTNPSCCGACVYRPMAGN